MKEEFKKNKFLRYYSVPASFFVLFIFGSILLLTGYTQNGLSAAIFNSSGYSKYFTWLLLTQSVGIIVGNIIIGRVIAKINSRYLIMISCATAATMLLLISQIKFLSNSVGMKIFYFSIFSFILGCSISPLNLIISVFISAIYQGNERQKMLSSVQGMYGIGLGAIPLFFANIVIGIKHSTNFHNTQIFYYIAIGLAIAGVILGFLINYQHTTQQSSSKILDVKTSGESVKIWKHVVFALLMMFALMSLETIANWSFVRVGENVASGGASNPSNNIKINITQAFGLMLVIQGLMRPLTGIFVLPYIDRKWYFIFSGIFLVTGFSWFMGGAFKHTSTIYIAAIILGMGIGNLWPVIFNYGVEIDNRRSTFIGVLIGVTGYTAPVITQLIIALAWIGINRADYTSFQFFVPLIIGLIDAAAILFIFLLTYKAHEKIKHQTQQAFKKVNIKK